MRQFKEVFLVLLTAFMPSCATTPEVAGPDTAVAMSVRSLVPDAKAVLSASLKDAGSSARTHAVEVAITTGQTALMPDILKLLEDRSVPVRFTAVIATGEMMCHGCLGQAKKALQDEDENVRIAAAYSLARLGQTGHIPLIREAAGSADATVRSNALLLLGKLGDKNDLKLLYRAMRDSNAADKVRLQALESIARLGDQKIYRDKLWPLLISKYADDRVTGIRAMGALGSAEAKTAILTMLSDEVPEVRLAAAEQLGRLNDRSGLDEVLAYLQSGPDLNQGTVSNGMAIMAIGYIGSERLDGYLAKALASSSKYIQLAAAQSILLRVK